MESKTLGAIQAVAKVGRILSSIVHVFCLVGMIICITGIISIGVPGSIKVGGVTVYSLLGNLEGVNLEMCCTAAVMGLIVCVAVGAVAKMAERYFTNELAAGTPFTSEGASELLRLGICTICIPLGAIVIAQMCNAIAMRSFESVAEISIDGSVPIALGLAFIAMSLVCKYGAELKGKQPVA